jgi:hypothetical protein
MNTSLRTLGIKAISIHSLPVALALAVAANPGLACQSQCQMRSAE